VAGVVAFQPSMFEVVSTDITYVPAIAEGAMASGTAIPSAPKSMSSRRFTGWILSGIGAFSRMVRPAPVTDPDSWCRNRAAKPSQVP
jgi:hypothetical protein